MGQVVPFDPLDPDFVQDPYPFLVRLRESDPVHRAASGAFVMALNANVMAPPGVLSAMLTVRVHLDDCGEGEGAMKVIPGSHEYGRLPQDSIEQFTGAGVELCAAEKGSLVAMRPLLLHASGTAPRPGWTTCPGWAGGCSGRSSPSSWR